MAKGRMRQASRRKLLTTFRVTRHNGVWAEEDLTNQEIGAMTDEQLGHFVRSLILDALQQTAQAKTREE